MKIAIMQPYFFPYIGYFQLIHSVDTFVLYDNIQFTKRGWIQRNKILNSGMIEYISLPIKNDSDYLNINQRVLAENFQEQMKKNINKLINGYQQTKNYNLVFPTIKECLLAEKENLFLYLFHTLVEILKIIGISKNIISSSTLNIDHALRGKEKVIAICKELDAEIYLNPIGGVELYDKNEFRKNNIKLQFIKPILKPYQQISKEFVSSLSVLDVLFNNDREDLHSLINSYGKI